jgi:hypothetical protein
MRPTRAGVLRLSVLLFAACSSTPPPPPPPPAEPQPPPPEAAPAAPPPKLTSIAVFDLRSVETERIPKTLVGSVSEKLRSSLTATGQVAVTGGADIPSAESCIDEACRIGLAKELSTQLVLHTRLIQYDLSCFLVAALY